MSRGLLHAQLPSRPKQTRVPTLSAPTLSTESMESLAKGKGDETDASLLARVERLGGFLGSTKVQRFPSPDIERRKKQPLVRYAHPSRRRPAKHLPQELLFIMR